MSSLVDARLSSIAFCALLALLGHRSYKTLLNPVSALVIPLGVALLVEEAFLPTSPFGLRAAGVLVLAMTTYTAGALVGSRPSNPLALHVELIRRRVSPAMMLVLTASCAVLVVAGGAKVKQIYDSAGVGFVGNGAFDRSLVVDAIAGTKSELVVRAITAFVFPTAVLVSLYWLSRLRLRRSIGMVFAFGVVLLSLGTRARLAAVLVIVLVGCLLLLASGKRRVVHRALPVVLLGPVFVFALFNQIANDRYGTTRSNNNTDDFVYATAGGPAALNVALTGEQPVVLLSAPTSHVRGQSIAGLLSLLGTARALGGFTPVYVETSASSQINIYTAAWPLMWDFGLIGMGIVMGLLGVTANFAFRRLLTRPSAGALLATANLLFLVICFPIALVSSYNLWWGLWALIPIVNRLFRVRAERERPGSTSSAYDGSASSPLPA